MKNSFLNLRAIFASAVMILAVQATLEAQQTGRFLMFGENPYLVNPAYAGWGEDVKAFAHYRNEMAGLRGAPTISTLTVDAPINSMKFGIGINAFNDKANLILRQGMNVSYAYKLPLPNEQKLSFGLSVGFVRNSIDQNEIVAERPDEITNFFNFRPSNSFNADFGVLYSIKTFEFGFSANNLLNRQQFDDPNLLQFDQNANLNFISRYRFAINSEWIARPSVVARSSFGLPFHADINAIVEWNDLLWFGPTYSTNTNLGVMTGINYEGLQVGYAYQYPFGPLAQLSQGAHEVMLSINFSKLKGKKSVAPQTGAAAGYKPKTSRSRIDTTIHIVVYEGSKEADKYKQIATSESAAINKLIAQYQANSETKASDVGVASTQGEEVYVVLGSFLKFENAKGFQSLVTRELGIETQLLKSKNGEFFMVTPGKSNSAAAATQQKQELETKGAKRIATGDIWFYKSK